MMSSRALNWLNRFVLHAHDIDRLVHKDTQGIPALVINATGIH